MTATHTGADASDTERELLERVVSAGPLDAYEQLGSSRKGLTSDQVAESLETHGPNLIAETKTVPLWRKFAQHLFNLFAILLWIGAVLSFLSAQAALGWAIVIVILINAVFAFFQEYRAERAVEALKQLLPAMSRVMRDGETLLIEASTLVPGDVIVVEEGDRVSADARLVACANMRVNNSALTGEAEPVARRSDGERLGDRPVTDLDNVIFAGTSVALGSGRAVVFATGMRTEFGKIAGLTQSVEQRLSPLQRKVAGVSKIISVIAVIIGVVFYLLGRFALGMTDLDAVILAIGIIVANVPEGLLPTLTMSLSVSTQRMAKRHVLVKRLSSVESLGSTTVICTDKTGTLTANEMTVREVYLPGYRLRVTGVGYEPTGEFVPEDGEPFSDVEGGLLAELLRASAMCNNSQLRPPNAEEPTWTILGDPTEAAMLVAAQKYRPLAEYEQVCKRVFENPFDSVRKRMSVVCSTTHGRVAFVKGAPRETVERCTHYMTPEGPAPMTDELRASALAINDEYALAALRVIAVAQRDVPEEADYSQVDAIETGLTLLGLTAMQDPPRLEVEEAIGLCHTAGIRVIMITGDYGLTAESIARRIGLVRGSDVLILTGPEIEALDDDGLRAKLSEAGEVIFARVVPEQKMRIAQTLQSMGEVVAMTGDGVNDAPALKAADIGIAMGVSGTDVAREAADMILTDDNFASIVAAVEEGRAIFDNIRRFLTYFQTSNVAEMIPFIVLVLFKVPLPLPLLMILTIDLVTDQIPALGLGLEAPEPGVMERPPHSPKEPLLSFGMIAKAYLFLGPLAAAIGLFGFFYRYIEEGWRLGLPMQSFGTDLPHPTGIYLAAATMTLTGIVMAQVGNAEACRTHTQSVFRVGLFKNRLVLVGMVSMVVLQAAIVYVPFLQRVIGTAPMSAGEWLVLAILAPTLLLADEVRKAILRATTRRQSGGAAQTR